LTKFKVLTMLFCISVEKEHVKLRMKRASKWKLHQI